MDKDNNDLCLKQRTKCMKFNMRKCSKIVYVLGKVSFKLLEVKLDKE